MTVSSFISVVEPALGHRVDQPIQPIAWVRALGRGFRGQRAVKRSTAGSGLLRRTRAQTRACRVCDGGDHGPADRRADHRRLPQLVRLPSRTYSPGATTRFSSAAWSRPAVALVSLWSTGPVGIAPYG